MRKVLAICVLMFLFAATGATIYAKTDSGQNLADWYKGAFQQESGKLGSVTAVEIIKGFADFNQFVSETASAFDDVIAALHDEKISDTQSEVENRQAVLVKEVNETVADLQRDNFDDYMDKLDIEEELTMEVEKMLEELLKE